MNMRQFFALAVIGLVVLGSCKKKSSDTPAGNAYTGIKSVSHRSVYTYADSVYGSYIHDTIHVKYNFTYSGSNIIAVAADVHPGNYGILKFNYSDGRLSSYSEFRYYNDDITDTQVYLTANIHYNSEGKMDTLTRWRSPHSFLDKYAFVYNGSNYQILYGPYQNYPPDPAYAYTYTLADNITHLTIPSGPSYDYATSPMNNNLSSSIPMFIVMSNIYGLDIRYSYPIIMTKNITNAWYNLNSPTDRTTYSHTITNNRVTRSIIKTEYDGMVDTMLYEYR